MYGTLLGPLLEQWANSCCCIFRPAFGCCTLQTLDEICLFNICAKKLKRKKKARHFASNFLLLCSKNVEKVYFNQHLEYAAPKPWSKYTTSCYEHSLFLWTYQLDILCLNTLNPRCTMQQCTKILSNNSNVKCKKLLWDYYVWSHTYNRRRCNAGERFVYVIHIL